MSSFSIVIPAYNEAESIKGVLTDLVERTAADIIVVDDGSTDGTAELVEAIVGVRLLRQAVNGGPIQAIMDGMKAANHPVVVTMDADGQHPIDRIDAIVEPIMRNEADLVLGVRSELPRLGEKVMAKVAGVSDATTGFRAYRKELYPLLENDYVYGGVSIIRAKQRNLRLLEVPIEVNPRVAGASVHSNWNILKKSMIFAMERALGRIH
ncbi:glycosyltransferase family 2 protein [Pullulanibacillus sp. KACC 23026]|uniref:glycosyltransferase family 2 protein n=1 Tax=Pullulanibacillus sp. KACC 23026 TaxID=3028315 RepID=UPI0023AE726D|nr:glycosyltransferase family 2 protein [Pullulanibacillus sp. KACC 23026]WEG13413.1 glycosyltransferase family 2 protein [Pullulanibacillus sp. KACC 23026]